MTQSNFLLPNEWASKIRRLSLNTATKIRGHHKGSHRSQRFGASLDFSDFREYHPGDDVRQLDWNVFARTEKYFIKRFLDEQEMRVHILLDTTKSMGDEAKWLFARQLATALGLTVLNRDDRLSFSYVSNKPTPPFRRKGSTYQKAYEKTIADLREPTSSESFAENAIRTLPKDMTILLIISDALEPLEEWSAFLSKVPRFAGDVRLIQVQSLDEKLPTYSGDVRLIDVETSASVNVSMSQNVLRSYEEKQQEHQLQLEALCRKYGVQHIIVQVADGIQHALFNQFIKAKWLQ
ncbi:DUF58 domain-containing protein [Viridibacillus sp. YIM B01967]|uniref:DUF58 domain-containing protein n=1 Tax=Viridibacillus soli TaxID=2798301 RepID=A0ABS1H7I3_9BACL|nr:DUF58 domain-containing protein [Viridibacillus soli]MBK3495380.1 DUF58 domain-containing protein [Viridibacillus soli]